MLSNGIKIEASISIMPSAMTYLEPGWSDAWIKDLITTRFPTVPDPSINIMRVKCSMSVDVYGTRKDSGKGIGDVFRSRRKEIAIFYH